MRYPLLLCLLCGLLVGCNADPRARRETALLRSEILDLEDQYYALQADHRRTLEELSECTGVPVETLRANRNTAVGSGIIETGDEIIIGEEWIEGDPIYYDDHVVVEPSSSHAPEQENFEKPTRGQPKSIITTPEDPTPPGTDDSPGEFPQAVRSPSGQSPTNRNLPANPGIRNQEFVSEIFINPSVSVAKNVDSIPGDDGLALLLQPRNPAGQTILKPGSITVRFLDPSTTDQNREVGVWTFAPTELELFQTRSSSGRSGYQFHLPWDLTIPLGNKLIVAVSYRASDGRVLKSTRTIRLQPPHTDYSPNTPLIAAWTEQIPTGNASSVEDPGIDPDANSNEPRRRGVRAIPAKTRTDIRQREWRPVR